jgi:hypothetical protein
MEQPDTLQGPASAGHRLAGRMAAPDAGIGAEMLARQRLDSFTHARLWKNPCGFAARFTELGLPGLEDCREWALLADASNDALGWLQSTTRGDVALAVVSPRRFVPDYQVRIPRSELTPRSVSRYGTVSRLGGGLPDLGSYPGGPGEGTMTFERISRSHFSAAA